MTLRIAPESPATPEAASLLAESDAFSAALYPPESRHGAALPALLRPEVTFLVARLDGRAAGCGALARQPDGSGELKRMIVAGNARGRGIGSALLAALETQAERQGIDLIHLETGVCSGAALALYRRAGYLERTPFGAYQPDPLSIFMEKRLRPPA